MLAIHILMSAFLLHQMQQSDDQENAAIALM